MKLTEWARQQGVHPKTALRWFQEGTLPVPARRVSPRTVLVETQSSDPNGGVALYARVSSHDQRSDLDRQLGRLVAWAAERGLTVTHTVAEVGSGMNGSRPKLRRLLADSGVTTIVVEHRDRLARLGSEYIEAALLGAGRRLVVLERTEVEDDLVPDMTEVLTSLCARLYGRRSARTRAARALNCAAQPVGDASAETAFGGNLLGSPTMVAVSAPETENACPRGDQTAPGAARLDDAGTGIVPEPAGLTGGRRKRDVPNVPS